LGEGQEGAYRFVDFVNNAVSGVEIVSGDKFPNFVEIRERVRMENKTAHARRRSRLF